MANTEAERAAAMNVSRSDRAKSLDSLHEVERAAGSAGPARPDEWRDDTLAALDRLADDLHEQHRRSASEDGLLAQTIEVAPRLAPAIDELRQAHRALEERINDLRMTLAESSRSVEVNAVRLELAEISARMRELRSWETDLVYEAYSVDLGAGD